MKQVSNFSSQAELLKFASSYGNCIIETWAILDVFFFFFVKKNRTEAQPIQKNPWKSVCLGVVFSLEMPRRRPSLGEFYVSVSRRPLVPLTRAFRSGLGDFSKAGKRFPISF